MRKRKTMLLPLVSMAAMAFNKVEEIVETGESPKEAKLRNEPSKQWGSGQWRRSPGTGTRTRKASRLQGAGRSRRTKRAKRMN